MISTATNIVRINPLVVHLISKKYSENIGIAGIQQTIKKYFSNSLFTNAALDSVFT